MWNFPKTLVFGRGVRAHRVWFGIAAGCRFLVDPATRTQRIVGLDEAEIAATFRRSIMGARTYIDVGASDGYYPIVALHLNPNLEVAIGCEPQAPLGQQARDNHRLNFPEGGRTMEWVSELIGDGAGQVSLDRLAENRPGPLLLKIDVDGAELEVLRSGSALLARRDCQVLLETHSEELETGAIALLQALNYSCRVIDNAWWRAIVPDERPIAWNRWVFAEKDRQRSS